jgi:hypothetical protein
MVNTAYSFFNIMLTLNGLEGVAERVVNGKTWN